MTYQVKFYQDAGHGWAAVKREVLKELGIAKQVTPFSYQSRSGKTVYLEEDGDLSLFYKAVEAKGDTVEVVKRSYAERSPIRNYPSYQEI